MGWNSGAQLAEDLWAIVEPHVVDEAKESVARAIVTLFENMDCDTMQECTGLLGIAATNMRLERLGAPENPEVGQTFVAYADKAYHELYEFDGTVWCLVEDEDA